MTDLMHGAFNEADLELVEKYVPDEPPLEVGELCRLRSGGPAMRVTRITPSPGGDLISVSWGDDGSSFFRRHVLKRMEQIAH